RGRDLNGVAGLRCAVICTGRGIGMMFSAIRELSSLIGIVVIHSVNPPYFASAFSFSAAYRMASTILLYPVQRHKLPEMPQRISSSVGLGFLLSRCLALIIMPGVQ